MRASHFAQIRVLVPPDGYKAGQRTTAKLKLVGMAQSINIDDNFGSRGENTIGTPLPVLAPGYQQTSIRLEKATIDGADFRNLGAFNPLWAHVGATYRSEIGLGGFASDWDIEAGESMYPFMFVLGVRNRVANSYRKSNITYDNNPSTGDGDPKARSSSMGVYVCVLQSASISMSANQAVIMDNVNAIARPVSGTWLNTQIKDAFKDSKVGMKDVIYNIMWGYNS